MDSHSPDVEFRFFCFDFQPPCGEEGPGWFVSINIGNLYHSRHFYAHLEYNYSRRRIDKISIYHDTL